ncbi:MAG: catalase [Clostridia bacterium]|nr:catalase [Clostridia bacterium]
MAHPIKHFITITKHRNKVISHCFKVGIGFQGMLHDMSKYGPAEFIPGAKYYQGTRSPNEREREIFGYSHAWMHHKGRNKHHFEYWVDLNMQTKQYEPVPMPLNFIAEMFCDRVAACKIYKGKDYTDSSALEYYLRGHARSKMHPDTADTLESWLKMLADKGEAETFAHIKTSVKANKKSAK